MTRKFVIDFKSSVPIFQQIVNEIERQILVGELKEGAFLTSVREYAVGNTVNPNTVAKAYQALQALGLVESVRGKGLAVKKVREKAASDRRDDIITEKIRELIEVGASLKLSVDDLVHLMKNIGRKK
jgi:GntR family transcriptional regulator